MHLFKFSTLYYLCPISLFNCYPTYVHTLLNILLSRHSVKASEYHLVPLFNRIFLSHCSLRPRDITEMLILSCIELTAICLDIKI
jgi:hypothetical protein